MIDLHIHSTASDGSLSPFQITTLALKSGVTAISITDHDTIDGVKAVMTASSTRYPEILSGVEISCHPPSDTYGTSSLHMLGYGFSIYDTQLNQILDQLQQARQKRNPEIIEKLNALGFDITIEEILEKCGEGQAGRPHIAQVMVEKGFVASFKEAFDKYLAKGKPGYVDKFRISCRQAIHVIKSAGGVPVLAHPGLMENEDSASIETLVESLVSDGLMGIEVYYSSHSPQQVACFERLAQQYGLLVTGGSDFHGTFSQGVDIGSGKGNLNIGYHVFSELKNKIYQIWQQYPDVKILEANLGHTFENQTYLTRALSHRSYLNEHLHLEQKDNERLEFLGDAVLGLCVGQLLMETFPDKKEGELSQLRSILVSEPGLATIARNIDLGRFIRLGKGEVLSMGHEKNSILSDTFEAVIAAVYLDAGFEKTFDLIRCLFPEKLFLGLQEGRIQDYKSILQEVVQETGKNAPVYEVLNETGPDHDKQFEVALMISGNQVRGIGKTKKAAEQNCARNVLEWFKKI